MGRIKLMVTIAFLSCLFAAPPVSSTNRDMVIIASTPPSSEKETKKTTLGKPIITAMDISSNITNRFAHTLIKSKVQNPSRVTQETTFFVVMPDHAYISSFTMEIRGNYYTAHVQEKEEAKKTYKEAVANGTSAAHVAVTVRHSNKFTVRVNVERGAKATFYLIYEELLERKFGYYEQIINIHPKQIVKSINVLVEINELRRLTFVKTPSIRSGNKVTKESEDLDPKAKIDRPENNKAVVKFSPDITRQKQIAHCLGTDEKEGMSGQFVIQYDVERDPQGGEVLINGGYFVHFFAPSNLESLHKYVVFVMDGSTSMAGAKMEQLKEAMKSILSELKPKDFFNLIVYDSRVAVLNLDRPSETTIFPQTEKEYYDSNLVFDITNVSFPQTYPVNKNTIEKAQKAITDMSAKGATISFEALRVGVHLVKLNQQRTGGTNTQGIVFFLTDGEATVGRTTPDSIMAGIAEENTIKVPIISLSFGNEANRRFLEKISLKNRGFTRHIYEESDATLQLENFYKEVSSPLLHNVKFSYTYDVTSLTQTEFPTFFGGAEFVVAGKIPDGNVKIEAEVSGNGPTGPLVLRPRVNRTVGQLERLWAYMTVKKHLDELKVGGDNIKDFKKKALDLALKFLFVTPVTSLVVVKPIESSHVATKDADSSGRSHFNVTSGFAVYGGSKFGGDIAHGGADGSASEFGGRSRVGGDISPGGAGGSPSEIGGRSRVGGDISPGGAGGTASDFGGGSRFGEDNAPGGAGGSPSEFGGGSRFGGAGGSASDFGGGSRFAGGSGGSPSDFAGGAVVGGTAGTAGRPLDFAGSAVVSGTAGTAGRPLDSNGGSGFDGDITPGGGDGRTSVFNGGSGFRGYIPPGGFAAPPSNFAEGSMFGGGFAADGTVEPPPFDTHFPPPRRPEEDLIFSSQAPKPPRRPTISEIVEIEEELPMDLPSDSTSEQATLPPEYKSDFGWLEQHLRPDGSISFLKGPYKLGYNETSPAHQSCKTPQSEEGLCKLIKDCDVLQRSIKNAQQFEEYFCLIDNKFAGVCCPN